jgi:hypothetical protein
MSLWAQLNLRERAFLGACLYLGALFVSCIIMWWLILIGGVPFKVNNLAVQSSTGLPHEIFQPGHVAGVKQSICSDYDVGLYFSPVLIDSRGYHFPLQGSLIEARKGCHDMIYGFVVPDLPAGEYRYSSAVKYQNNLVGRDETTTFPQLRIRITR